jgi:hypothetical protein
VSSRDSNGRRVSVPDQSFIDQVGDIARRVAEDGRTSIGVDFGANPDATLTVAEALRDPTFTELATAAQRRLERDAGRSAMFGAAYGMSEARVRDHIEREVRRGLQSVVGRNVADAEVRARMEELIGNINHRIETVTGRMSSRGPNISSLPRPGAMVDLDYRQLEMRTLASMGMSEDAFRREYLGTFPEPIPVEENFEEVTHGEELEIVTRTTTTRTTTRRRSTPARSSVSGPTNNAPVYIWAMQSSVPRNGGEYIQYEVRLNEDGTTSCNCPGWVFKKKTEVRGCKHTRHVEDEAKVFHARHKRGEQLPTTAPTAEQLMRASNTKAGKKAAEAGESTTIKFGRFIDLD